jgi:aspergillopepsin I
MPSFSTLISGALLVAIAAATPLPLDATAAANKGFTIHQNIAKPYAPGPVALMETYIKYNITVPTDVKAAAADGTVGAIPEPFDSQYLSPVSIGGQTLNLDFDTGSSDLYAPQMSRHNHY